MLQQLSLTLLIGRQPRQSYAELGGFGAGPPLPLESMFENGLKQPGGGRGGDACTEVLAAGEVDAADAGEDCDADEDAIGDEDAGADAMSTVLVRTGAMTADACVVAVGASDTGGIGAALGAGVLGSVHALAAKAPMATTR